MTDPDSSGAAAAPPADPVARRKAAREAVQSVIFGVVVSVVAIVAIWVLFTLDLSLLLVLAFFGGVALFAARIAREEREWRDRTGR